MTQLEHDPRLGPARASTTTVVTDPPSSGPSRSPRTGTVAVVVPTFNEAANVGPLVRELRTVLAGPDADRWEILFVDDSDDDTPAEVRAAASSPGVRVRLLHRDEGSRTGGLGGAVVAGMRATSAETVVVMDGDLQHPPATVPRLVDALRGHDVAVASRYVADGSSSGLANGLRHLVSTASTRLCRTLFPRRLAGCTDPMTGFFAVRRAAVRPEVLEPMGFKILLEILARHDLSVTEVPFVFGERLAGRSKADVRQGLTFLWQVLNLRVGRLGRFAAVGATGLVVNLVAMALLLGGGTGYVLASLLATEVAILSNFVLQERLVFADVPTRSSLGRRLWQSLAFNNLEAVLRLPLLVLVVEALGQHELMAQALVITAAFAVRFAVMNSVVYRTAPAPLVVGPVAGATVATAYRDALGARRVPRDLDVVIPALDEEGRLGATLAAVRAELARAPYTSRIIIVDNGCTDATADVVNRASGDADVDLISCGTRGKGAAVRAGVLHSTSARVAYCDADLSTPPSALRAGVDLLDAGADLVVGSRKVHGAEIAVPQPLVRRWGGRAFNRAATALVGPMPDTQCGMKVMRGDVARDVFAEMRLDGYAFDVELIARMQQRRAAIAELAVRWSDDDGTRLRITSDGYRAFRDLVAVRRAVGKSVEVQHA